MLCFRKLKAAKKIMGIGRRGSGDSSFLLENFLSHGAESFHFLGELFSFSQVSGIENNLRFRGLSHHFLSRFLLSQRVGKYHR